jgi:hypothetical protein
VAKEVDGVCWLHGGDVHQCVDCGEGLS